MLRRHRRKHVPPQPRELQAAGLAQALRPLDHVSGLVPTAAAGPTMTVRVMRVTVRGVAVTVAASVALAVLMRRVTAHPDLPDIGARDRRRATRIAAWPRPIRQGLNSTRVD
ncbi:hypothetical protein GCM10008965_07820 [Methylorubrum aminovorans]|nr:hypothetical protein GCM10025880_38580 [Methylorubrum aminovorans]